MIFFNKMARIGYLALYYGPECGTIMQHSERNTSALLVKTGAI